MDTWTRQAGFPVISVTRNETKLTLSQQRFLADSNAEYSLDSSPYKYKWEIPITYVTSENKTVNNLWFTKDQDSSMFHSLFILILMIYLFNIYLFNSYIRYT